MENKRSTIRCPPKSSDLHEVPLEDNEKRVRFLDHITARQDTQVLKCGLEPLESLTRPLTTRIPETLPPHTRDPVPPTRSNMTHLFLGVYNYWITSS